jgi:hypothetical protein
MCERRVFLALFGRLRLEGFGDLRQTVALHDIGDANEFRRVAFQSPPAIQHLDVGRRGTIQSAGRARQSHGETP